ncbi:unnamed protein product [Closterium sp. Naga37s-1]|nr:unnamed protein product [Closterium sp. Naga37s-1]
MARKLGAPPRPPFYFARERSDPRTVPGFGLPIRRQPHSWPSIPSPRRPISRSSHAAPASLGTSPSDRPLPTPPHRAPIRAVPPPPHVRSFSLRLCPPYAHVTPHGPSLARDLRNSPNSSPFTHYLSPNPKQSSFPLCIISKQAFNTDLTMTAAEEEAFAESGEDLLVEDLPEGLIDEITCSPDHPAAKKTCTDAGAGHTSINSPATSSDSALPQPPRSPMPRAAAAPASPSRGPTPTLAATAAAPNAPALHAAAYASVAAGVNPAPALPASLFASPTPGGSPRNLRRARTATATPMLLPLRRRVVATLLLPEAGLESHRTEILAGINAQLCGFMFDSGTIPPFEHTVGEPLRVGRRVYGRLLFSWPSQEDAAVFRKLFPLMLKVSNSRPVMLKVFADKFEAFTAAKAAGAPTLSIRNVPLEIDPEEIRAFLLGTTEEDGAHWLADLTDFHRASDPYENTFFTHLAGLPVATPDDPNFEIIPSEILLEENKPAMLLNFSCHVCALCGNNHRAPDHEAFAARRRGRLTNKNTISIAQLQQANGTKPAPLVFAANTLPPCCHCTAFTCLLYPLVCSPAAPHPLTASRSVYPLPSPQPPCSPPTPAPSPRCPSLPKSPPPPPHCLAASPPARPPGTLPSPHLICPYPLPSLPPFSSLPLRQLPPPHPVFTSVTHPSLPAPPPPVSHVVGLPLNPLPSPRRPPLPAPSNSCRQAPPPGRSVLATIVPSSAPPTVGPPSTLTNPPLSPTPHAISASWNLCFLHAPPPPAPTHFNPSPHNTPALPPLRTVPRPPTSSPPTRTLPPLPPPLADCTLFRNPPLCPLPSLLPRSLQKTAPLPTPMLACRCSPPPGPICNRPLCSDWAAVPPPSGFFPPPPPPRLGLRIPPPLPRASPPSLHLPPPAVNQPTRSPLSWSSPPRPPPARPPQPSLRPSPRPPCPPLLPPTAPSLAGNTLGNHAAPTAFRSDPGLLYIGLGDWVEYWTCALCDFTCSAALDSAMEHIQSDLHATRVKASAHRPAAKEEFCPWSALTLLQQKAPVAAFLRGRP